MFRTVFPSIIRSLRLYIQHQAHVILKFEKWVQLLVSVYIHSLVTVLVSVYVYINTLVTVPIFWNFSMTYT